MKQYKLTFLSLSFLFCTVFSINAQDLFMTSIASHSDLASSITPNLKIQPTGATASSFQVGEEISKAIDGNYSTMYHSSWASTSFPVTLQFAFPEDTSLDYIVYHPRVSGSNGYFRALEVYYTTYDNPNEVKVGDYNFNGSPFASSVYFPSTIDNVKNITFKVLSGEGGFASCSEMEFYKQNKSSISGVELFEDNLLTTLKPGVTMTDVKNIENPYMRELAYTIYQGNYSKEFRTGTFYPYMDRASFSAKYTVPGMTTAYNLYENPTGIYFPIGKHIVIVENLNLGQSVSLIIPNYTYGNADDWSLPARSYSLSNGINIIDVTGWAGIGYISYFTPDWETSPSLNIHFPLGIEQGYFDIKKHKNVDFVRLLANANAYKFFDVVGDRVHLAYTVDAYRNNTGGKAEELIARCDTMVIWEQRYMGWEKYLNLPKNRVHFRANQSYYMYKDNTGVSFEHGTMGILANPTRFFTSNWGPCHEVGHIHQYRFNNWTGLGEVSVNFPNLVFVQEHLRPVHGTGEIRPDLQKSYNSLAKKNSPTVTIPFLAYDQTTHNGTVDIYDARLAAFAQLYYYFLEKGYKDYFPDLNQALRNTTDNTAGWGISDYEMNFVKKVCDLTQLNLIPFFEKWGWLYHTNTTGRAPFQVGDYSSGTYSLTKAKVDDLKAYIQTKGYPLPSEDLTLVDRNGKRLTP